MNAHTLINTSGQGGSNNKGFKRQVYLYMWWPWGTWSCMQASPKHRVHLQTRCVNAACGAAGAIKKKTCYCSSSQKVVPLWGHGLSVFLTCLVRVFLVFWSSIIVCSRNLPSSWLAQSCLIWSIPDPPPLDPTSGRLGPHKKPWNPDEQARAFVK